MLTKQQIFFLTFFLLISEVIAQKGPTTLHGYLRDKNTGEPLKGIVISVPEYNIEEISDFQGFYSIAILIKDSTIIHFNFIGYKTVKKTISARDFRLDITMEIDTSILDEVVVETSKSRASDDPRLGVLTVQTKQIQNIPSLFGEKDVMKVLQLMPGVQKSNEGNAGLYVRGGGPDQNLILIDNAPIYNSSHLFGFFSVFNNDALKSVELIKAGFPARHGGRLSSVLELKTKDGSKEQLKAQGMIGLISSKILLEGPIKKGKSSFLISARRTYIDLITKPFLNKNRKVGYYFYDINAKYHHVLGPKDNLRFSGFVSQDKFKATVRTGITENTSEMNWRNIVSSLQWNHLFSNNTSADLIIYTTRYNLINSITDGDDGIDKWTSDYKSYIQDFGIKYNWTTRIFSKHQLLYGIQAIYHRFRPGVNNTTYENTLGKSRRNPSEKLFHGVESGLYLEHLYSPIPILTLNTGFRINYYTCRQKTYISPEPRFTASVKLSPYSAFNISYSRMNQYVHLLSTTSFGPPLDIWVPATDKTSPMNSQQIGAGLIRDIDRWKAFASLEGFYKINKNIITYKNGGNSFSFQDEGQYQYWEDIITPGKGWSYGLEALIKRTTGKFTGWIGYTLSWTWVKFDMFNKGEKFYARYDRRHDGSVVIIYQPNKRFTFASTWTYGTGNAITLPYSLYRNSGNDNYLIEYSPKNGYRMPAYHRLDFSAQFHKVLKNDRERTWEISIYNAYNRHNPYYYFQEEKGESKNPLLRTRVLNQIILFPILPSFTYRITFI